MTPDELEERIRDAMTHEIHVLPPQLWNGIVEARRRNQVLALPVGAPAHPFRRWIAAAVIMLAVGTASVMLVSDAGRGPGPEQTGNRRAAPLREDVDESPFLPASLLAQVSASPAYDRADARIGTRLKAGRWTYLSDSRSDAHGSTTVTFALTRAEYAGLPAWLLVTGSNWHTPVFAFRDTLWASLDSLRPLARSFPISGGRVEQTFREHEVLTGTTMNGFTSWTTAALSDSSPGNNGGLLRLADIALRLQTMPLAADWKGSIPLQGTSYGGVLAPVWLNVRVDGEAEIEVPAGRFLCWRVRTRYGPDDEGSYRPDNPQHGIYFYVSKDRQWLIQQTSIARGKGEFSERLVSAEQDP